MNSWLFEVDVSGRVHKIKGLLDQRFTRLKILSLTVILTLTISPTIKPNPTKAYPYFNPKANFASNRSPNSTAD